MSNPSNQADPLLARLAELDAEPTQSAEDSTVLQLRQELDVYLNDLRQPAPADPFETEPACRAATVQVQALARDPESISVSAGDALPLGSVGQYELLAKLGEGGMGAVYKARHAKLDKIVALKILPPGRTQDKSAVARFEREMRAVGKLDHPNIVRAMDAGEVGGMHFLVMELVQGIDLAQLVKQRGPLPIAEACELIRQAAIGLDEAHDIGMVHRDIKPSNLMLCQSGKRKPPVVKVLDLGLALLSEAHSVEAQGLTGSDLTGSGQLMGTLDYMAPEQGGDSHVVDLRADIYSLGATLYKLLTGEAIYHGPQYQSPVQKLMALANQPARPIESRRAGIPAELAKIVHRMLEKSPSQRYATTKEVADALAPFCGQADLAALLATGSAAPSLGGPTPRTSSPARRPPRWGVAVAAAGLAALLAGVLIFWQTPQGTVRIEINDDNIGAQVDAQGVEIKRGNDKPLRVEPGEHGLRIKHGDLEFQTDKFVLARGAQVALKVELLAGQMKVTRNGEPLGLSPVAGQTPAPPPVANSTKFTNSLGMEFALVPKGKSWLGGGGGKVGDKEVEFQDDFYLGVYEVTQEEWEKVTGLNPSHFSRTGAGKDAVKDVSDADLKRLPVDSVSWGDAQLFLGRLNAQDKQAGWVYRLPTAVEWEYACRGGPMRDKFDGAFDYYLDKPANLMLPGEANFAHDQDLERTCSVGSYKPNRLGLYDMHGNVWEWPSDEIQADVKDPNGVSLPVIHGGGWYDDASICRAAGRGMVAPSSRRDAVGFRVARVPVETTDRGLVERSLDGLAQVRGQADASASDYDKLATGRWMPVLAGPGKSVELRNAAFSDGRIEVQNGHAYDRSIQATDVIVRAKVQKISGQSVQLTLRDVLGVYYSAIYQNDGVERFGIGTRDTRFRSSVMKHFESGAGVPEGEFFELAFAALGDTLTVYANGKQVGEIRNSAISKAGGVAAHATKGKGVFKDVEVMVLDKPATKASGDE